MNVQMCVHSARVTPPLAQHDHGRILAKRIARVPYMQDTLHTIKLTRTQRQNFALINKSIEKNAPKGAGSSVAIAAMF